MADIQPSSRLQPGHELAPEPLLRRFVEIDHDVSAEYRLKRPPHRPVLHQIQRPERDQTAKRFADAPLLLAVAAMWLKEALAQVRRNIGEQRLGVDALLPDLEDV